MKETFEKPVIAKYEMRLNENIAVSGPQIEIVDQTNSWNFTHTPGSDPYTFSGKCYHYLAGNTGDYRWGMEYLIDLDLTSYVAMLAELIREYDHDDIDENNIYVRNCYGKHTS